MVNDENFRDTTKFDQSTHKGYRLSLQITKSNSLADKPKKIT